MDDLRNVQTIELESLKDLVKLLVSSIREPIPITILHHVINGKHVFSATQIMQGFYDLKGLPLTFYSIYEGDDVKPFIAYKTSEDGEELKFVDGIHDLSYRYLAVVNTKSVPKFLLPIDL